MAKGGFPRNMGMGGMGNMNNMIKQAQKMQEEMLKAQELDEYEEEEQFTLEFVTPKQAIEVNENADHGDKADSQTFAGMILRENKVLQIIKAEIM